MSALSLVTPTYWRDLELCRLLCESVDRYVASYEKHYLLVADEELPLFAGFNGGRRVVLPASQLLPGWLKPLPRFIRRKSRRYWWSLRTMPVSGWHVQQFLKIAAAAALPEERYCMLDSDVVFFRNFDMAALDQPAPTPLFIRPGEIAADAPLHAHWARTTSELLGIEAPTFPADDFIDHIITWDRHSVRAMTARIEAVTGMGWVEALCRARDISEYILYGAFVRHDPALLARHRLAPEKLCVSHWDDHALDKPAIERMLAAADRNYVAFSAASFSATPVNVVRSAISEFAEPRMQVA